jgi:nucleotide-binding universal stress UspA family protein
MFETVVWATDGSPAADEALPYARALASGEGRSLVVVHSKELFLGRAGGLPVLADEKEIRQKIRVQVDELRDEGIDARFELVVCAAGGAAQAIADVARDARADLIVVGTRGHGALAGLLVGSVTKRLLHVAPCPVLAVPAGKHSFDGESTRETVAVH